VIDRGKGYSQQHQCKATDYSIQSAEERETNQHLLLLQQF
jgi:hypothetical protein